MDLSGVRFMDSSGLNVLVGTARRLGAGSFGVVVSRPSIRRIFSVTGIDNLEAQSKGGRKLGTCGPPPRKNPLRQTSAEGMPPLPLPAVPLRRSEPKAEPAAPLCSVTGGPEGYRHRRPRGCWSR